MHQLGDMPSPVVVGAIFEVALTVIYTHIILLLIYYYYAPIAGYALPCRCGRHIRGCSTLIYTHIILLLIYYYYAPIGGYALPCRCGRHV
jgi:hypothetical protein